MTITSDTRTQPHAERHPGMSLTRDHYLSSEIFARDVDWLRKTQWLLVDHESRIKSIGEWFTFDFGGESIIVLRAADRAVNAFYNVCRHRGSRICLTPSGKSKMLTCPYHSWTYRLDGQLRRPRFMPENFDPSKNGLIPCHLRIYDGLIFVNLSDSAPPDFESCVDRMRPFLGPHRLAAAKVAARRSYPMAANWKLAVENFFECYHCTTAHPTYCSVHDAAKLIAFGAGDGSSDGDIGNAYGPVLRQWEAKAREMGHYTGMFADSFDTPYFQGAARLPISNDAKSETVDGQPASMLMGEYRGFDGGQTSATFNPLATVLANNDFAMIFRFTPRDAELTDMEAIWLVHLEAEEGRDYNVDNLIHVYDVTLGEDKKIVENNHCGVRSRMYGPGYYSTQEQRIADFAEWYLRGLAGTPGG